MAPSDQAPGARSARRAASCSGDSDARTATDVASTIAAMTAAASLAELEALIRSASIPIASAWARHRGNDLDEGTTQ